MSVIYNETIPPVTKRPRGRPKGSRNKPKPAMPALAVAPAAMRIPAAACYLDVSKSLIKKLIAQGRLRSTTIGRARLVLTSSPNGLLDSEE